MLADVDASAAVSVLVSVSFIVGGDKTAMSACPPRDAGENQVDLKKRGRDGSVPNFVPTTNPDGVLPSE